MAREYAQIKFSIWNDDDFRDLTGAAQHLYFVLLTDPDLSYAGTGDWHPGRVAAKVSDWTREMVERAAGELIQALYIVVDDETGEFLIRSFVRNDSLMKQRNLGVSMAMARANIASRGIRGILVHELKRLKAEQPELAGFKPEQVTEVLGMKAVDPGSFPCGNPYLDPGTDPSIDPQVDPSVDPTADPYVDPRVKGQVGGQPPPGHRPGPYNSNYNTNLNLPTSTSPEGGKVVREGTTAREASDPPPQIPETWIENPRLARCAAHAGIDDPPPCVGCRDARRAAEEAGHARAREQMARAAAVKAERDACTLCDPAGFILGVDEAIRCTHDPDRNGEAVLAADTARREREAADKRARDAAKAAAAKRKEPRGPF